MPEKITLEDGTEREVLTAEEQEELQKNSKKFDELNTQYQTLQDEIKELEEGANPNWKEIRQSKKRSEAMEKSIREQGFNIQEDGSLVKGKKDVDPDELVKLSEETAKKTTQETLHTNHIDNKIAHYDKEVQDAIKLKYNKLSSGEDVSTLGSVDSFLNEAIGIVSPEETVPPHMSHHSPGGAPRFGNQHQDITNDTLEMGKQFGVTEEQIKKGGDVSDLIFNK